MNFKGPVALITLFKSPSLGKREGPRLLPASKPGGRMVRSIWMIVYIQLEVLNDPLPTNFAKLISSEVPQVHVAHAFQGATNELGQRNLMLAGGSCWAP